MVCELKLEWVVVGMDVKTSCGYNYGNIKEMFMGVGLMWYVLNEIKGRVWRANGNGDEWGLVFWRL